MEMWQRLLVIGIVVGLTLAVAQLIDKRIMGANRSPEAMTRYRVLRRTIAAGIITIGVLSALLVIPQVRAVAGGLLASSAILGLIIGFASQRTLGNFVAGLMIAMTQPLRLGDWIEVAGVAGSVEEIGLMYTFIRTDDNARLVIPNEKLASDTILNSTIVSREKLAQVSVQVPLDKDLDAVVDLLRSETAGDPRAEVLVSGLNGTAMLTVRSWAPEVGEVEQVESELRLRVARRLREKKLL